MAASQNKPVHLKFEPVNMIFNVMNASMGDRHQVVLKIVKQLDNMMIRDISLPLKHPVYCPEPPLDFLDIPRPTFRTSSFDDCEEAKDVF